MLFSKASIIFAIVTGVAAATATENAIGAVSLNKGSLSTAGSGGHELAGWRDDLPWGDLTSMLSALASLVDTSPATYIDECCAEFEKPQAKRTNHAMIDQPSGLCMHHFFCAFDRCYPNPTSLNTTLNERLQDTGPAKEKRECDSDILHPRLQIPGVGRRHNQSELQPSYQSPISRCCF